MAISQPSLALAEMLAAGRNDMKRMVTSAAAAALLVLTSMLPVRAAPPTVTPSPGYDARLQQSRAAPTVVEPVAPMPPRKPVQPSRTKHKTPH